MSESAPAHASEGNGQIPAWMQTVDEETFYNAGTNDEASTDSASSSTAPPTDSRPQDPSARPQAPSSNASQLSDGSSLKKDLALSMAAPSDIPEPVPELQPTAVGHVRADLENQLQKAVSVLATRYASGFSRSLVLEYALQRTLLRLRREGEDSAVVQWLDSVLPRS